MKDGHDALYYAEQLLRTTYVDSGSRGEHAEEIIAVLQKEAEWRRVKNFVAFLHAGQPNLLKYIVVNNGCQILSLALLSSDLLK